MKENNKYKWHSLWSYDHYYYLGLTRRQTNIEIRLEKYENKNGQQKAMRRVAQINKWPDLLYRIISFNCWNLRFFEPSGVVSGCSDYEAATGNVLMSCSAERETEREGWSLLYVHILIVSLSFWIITHEGSQVVATPL